MRKAINPALMMMEIAKDLKSCRSEVSRTADFIKFTKTNEVVEKKEDDFKKLNDRLDNIVALIQSEKGGKNEAF